jgi:hypothetical protein
MVSRAYYQGGRRRNYLVRRQRVTVHNRELRPQAFRNLRRIRRNMMARRIQRAFRRMQNWRRLRAALHAWRMNYGLSRARRRRR